MQSLLESGISARRGVMCSHRELAYEGVSVPGLLLESVRAQDTTILLPLYCGLGFDIQTDIVAALASAIKAARA
jgi:hypothetical protein